MQISSLSVKFSQQTTVDFCLIISLSHYFSPVMENVKVKQLRSFHTLQTHISASLVPPSSSTELRHNFSVLPSDACSVVLLDVRDMHDEFSLAGLFIFAVLLPGRNTLCQFSASTWNSIFQHLQHPFHLPSQWKNF